jgi:hypothetical protein
MMKVICVILGMVVLPLLATAQKKDTLVVKDSAGTIVSSKPLPKEPLKKTDTVKKHSPRKAALYSAVLPGLGQAYNKKYWKIPLAWAAVGIPITLFFDNQKWYNRTRYGLAVVANNTAGNTSQAGLDSMARVHPKLRPLVDAKAEGSLLRYRNEFRKDMDYSILFTLLLWGLNVVDATVDAHLKGFNVSDDLSLKIKPSLLPGNVPGITFAFNFR